MSRFYINLSDDEFIRLAKVALKETRSTQDQARYFLRCALGLEDAGKEEWGKRLRYTEGVRKFE